MIPRLQRSRGHLRARAAMRPRRIRPRQRPGRRARGAPPYPGRSPPPSAGRTRARPPRSCSPASHDSDRPRTREASSTRASAEASRGSRGGSADASRGSGSVVVSRRDASEREGPGPGPGAPAATRRNSATLFLGGALGASAARYASRTHRISASRRDAASANRGSRTDTCSQAGWEESESESSWSPFDSSPFESPSFHFESSSFFSSSSSSAFAGGGPTLRSRRTPRVSRTTDGSVVFGPRTPENAPPPSLPSPLAPTPPPPPRSISSTAASSPVPRERSPGGPTPREKPPRPVGVGVADRAASAPPRASEGSGSVARIAEEDTSRARNERACAFEPPFEAATRRRGARASFPSPSEPSNPTRTRSSRARSRSPRAGSSNAAFSSSPSDDGKNARAAAVSSSCLTSASPPTVTSRTIESTTAGNGRASGWRGLRPVPRGGSRHARRHAPRGVASWTPNARHSPRLEGWTANANAGGDEASSFETGDASEGEEAEEEGSRSSPGSRDDPRNATSHSSAHPTLKCACGGRSAAPVAESWRWWSWPPANGAPPSVLHAYRRSIETRGADANKFVEEEDAGDDDAGDETRSKSPPPKSPPPLPLPPPPPPSRTARTSRFAARTRARPALERSISSASARTAPPRNSPPPDSFANASSPGTPRDAPAPPLVVPENTGTPSFREKTPSHPSGIEHRVPEPALDLDPDLPPKQRARDVPRRERRRGIARVDARVAAAAPPRPRRGDVRRSGRRRRFQAPPRGRRRTPRRELPRDGRERGLERG